MFIPLRNRLPILLWTIALLIPLTAYSEEPEALETVTFEEYEEVTSPGFSVTRVKLTFECGIGCVRLLGDFLGIGRAQILLIDRNTKSSALVTWNSAEDITLLPLPQFIEPTAAPIYTVGDFRNLNRDQIVQLQSNGESTLVSFQNGNFERLATGALPVGTHRLGSIVEGLREPAVLVVAQRPPNGRYSYFSLQEDLSWKESEINFGAQEIEEPMMFTPPRFRINPAFFSLVKEPNVVLIYERHGIYTEPRRGFFRHSHRIESATHMAAGDFDGDGLSDVLAVYPGSLRWDLLRFGQRGTAISSIPPILTNFAELTPGDINGDGIDDLVSVDTESPSQLLLLLARSAPLLERKQTQIPVAITREMRKLLTRTQIRAILEWAGSSLTDDQFARVPASWKEDNSSLVIRFTRYRRHINSGTYTAPGWLLPERHPGPFLCTGETATISQAFARQRTCPPDHYVTSMDDPGKNRLIGSPHTWVNCCPLPAEDIVRHDDPKLTVERECPENYIVTGLADSPSGPIGLAADLLVCSPLNTEKYQLSKENFNGIYWGFGASERQNPQRLDFRQLPFGLRVGIRRVGEANFDIDGCVSSQPGTALTRLDDFNHCSDAGFRQLVDANTKQPIPMFHECKTLPEVSISETVCR